MNEHHEQAWDLNPEQRRQKIAAILAAGILRLRARAALWAQENGLENQRIPV